jgi:hypothetical protein
MKKLLFVVAAMTVLSARLALAQAAPNANKTSAPANNTSTAGKEMQQTAQNTPQCQHIIVVCKQLGFIQGQYKIDNGLWKDCFDPVVSGKGGATRDGKPVTVPANPSDVTACHAALAANKKA